MKGTFFQKPLELNLVVEGESWRQGDKIAGNLLARNHGAEPVPLEDIRVRLAFGNLTRVRQKSADAFSEFSSVATGSGSLLPGGEQRLSWSFSTDRNAPVTHRTGSLFLLYGRGSENEKLGQLQLRIGPYWVIEELLGIFQTNLHYVLKDLKSAKGMLEAKLVPPASKAATGIEQLVLASRFEGESLRLQYVFNLKTLDASGGTVELQKKKKEFPQLLEPAEFLLPSGRFNHEPVEAKVRSILDQLGWAAYA
jgi:hypothetical protein